MKTLVIPEITGEVAIKANLQVGELLDSGVSAEIRGAVEASLMDCYKITCFEGGESACAPVTKWTICASSGCPD